MRSFLLFSVFLASSLGLPLFSQEDPKEAQYSRLDTAIAWLSDGVKLPDAEALGRRRSKPETDPEDVIAAAKERAAKEKKLILWYVPRQPGSHMNRAAILDGYLKTAVFSDPEVAEFVNRAFVPVRCCVTTALASDHAIRRFAFVEPGFLFLNPQGETVHVVDRLRTFNADWCLALFRAVLAKHPEFAVKEAAPGAGLLDRAKEARRRRDGKAALELLDKVPGPEALAEKGRVLLHLGRVEDAMAALEKASEQASPRQAEALYYRALGAMLSRRSADARGLWERLVKSHAGTTWAARAASNLVVREDSLPMGPGAHNFECLEWPPEAAMQELPTSTRWARTTADADDIARRAVEWLLRHQDQTGGWTDSRYVYCDSPKILPNVDMAVTSLAAAALLEWRDVAPARIDAALAAAIPYLMDEKRMARRQNEEAYADAYRLLFLARRQAGLTGKDRNAGLDAMKARIASLAGQQRKSGLFWHEYENPFVTAAVVQCLDAAKRAGGEVPDAIFTRTRDGLERCRSKDARYTYAGQGRPSVAKDCSSRSPMCEDARRICGGEGSDVAAALARFAEFLDRQEAVRVCDFHSDGELGGFFFFHGFFHATEAARALPPEKRAEFEAKLLEHLVKIPEWDGSFLDSHELGKSYGTAMALLSLRNLKPGAKEY